MKRIKKFTAEEARVRMCRGKKNKFKILMNHLWRRINRAVENGKSETETNGYFYDIGGTVPDELAKQGEELIEDLCQFAKEELEEYGYNVVIDKSLDCSRFCKSFTIKIDWKEPAKEAADENKV